LREEPNSSQSQTAEAAEELAQAQAQAQAPGPGPGLCEFDCAAALQRQIVLQSSRGLRAEPVEQRRLRGWEGRANKPQATQAAGDSSTGSRASKAETAANTTEQQAALQSQKLQLDGGTSDVHRTNLPRLRLTAWPELD
jgi:hypothetical protein